MVDQHRVGPPTHRRRFAQIVDDPGIDVRHRPEQDVGPVVVREAGGLAGQDELRAVRAEVDQRVGLEFFVEPEIGRQVVVGRWHELVVQQRGVVCLAAERLRQQDHVAQVDPRHHDVVLAAVLPDKKLSRRRAPAGTHFELLCLRHFGFEPLPVLVRGNQHGFAATGEPIQLAGSPDADLPTVVRHQPQEGIVVDRHRAQTVVGLASSPRAAAPGFAARS